MVKKKDDKYVKFLIISNNYLEKYLSKDVILKISNYYKNRVRSKIKWINIYMKTNIAINPKNPALIKLHEYHDYARNITMAGHLCYEKNKWLIGQKLIKLSTTIHFLVSQLIIKTIKLREIYL